MGWSEDRGMLHCQLLFRHTVSQASLWPGSSIQLSGGDHCRRAEFYLSCMCICMDTCPKDKCPAFQKHRKCPSGKIRSILIPSVPPGDHKGGRATWKGRVCVGGCRSSSSWTNTLVELWLSVLPTYFSPTTAITHTHTIAWTIDL